MIKKLISIFVVFVLITILYGCKNKEYNITFFTNNGSDVVEGYVLKEGDEIAFPTPEKEGHVFKGWYMDDSFKEECTITNMPEKDVNVYAKWAPVYTEGLEFVMQEDDTYAVERYEGNSEEVVIPYSYEDKPVTTMNDSIFDRQISVKRIKIPASITTINSRAFGNAFGLKEIIVDSENSQFSSENGILYNKDKTTIVSYPSAKPETTFTIPDSVVTIGDEAFSTQSTLINVVLTDNIETIGNYAFYSAHKLTELTIPKNVKNIGIEAFSATFSLSSFHVDSKNNYFSSLDGILYNKEKTELIKYPEAKIDEDFIMPDSVTSVRDYSFYSVRFLINITLSDHLTHIGDYAFHRTESIRNIEIPNTVTSIGSYAFLSSKGLLTVTFEEGCQLTTLSHGIFQMTLFDFIIPESITTIDSQAFMQTHLSSITIPSNVISIGYQAFAYSTLLENITLLSTTPPEVSGSYQNQFIELGEDFKIYVPAEAVDDYKTADVWSHYADLIYPIE